MLLFMYSYMWFCIYLYVFTYLINIMCIKIITYMSMLYVYNHIYIHNGIVYIYMIL